MEAALGFSLIVYMLLQEEFAFEAIQLGLVPAFSCCIGQCQCFRKHCEPCLWLLHDAICLSEERKVIRSAYLSSHSTPSCQALGELLDSCLCLSLVGQGPAA